jgi:hypothetical protein
MKPISEMRWQTRTYGLRLRPNARFCFAKYVDRLQFLSRARTENLTIDLLDGTMNQIDFRNPGTSAHSTSRRSSRGKTFHVSM